MCTPTFDPKKPVGFVACGRRVVFQTIGMSRDCGAQHGTKVSIYVYHTFCVRILYAHFVCAFCMRGVRVKVGVSGSINRIPAAAYTPTCRGSTARHSRRRNQATRTGNALRTHHTVHVQRADLTAVTIILDHSCKYRTTACTVWGS